MPITSSRVTAGLLTTVIIVLMCRFALAAEGSGLYAGVGVGAAYHSNLNPSNSQIDAGYQQVNLPSATSVHSTDTGFKGLVGYQISKDYAVEGGYVDLGRVKFDTAVLPSGGFGQITRKVSGWNLDLLAFAELPKNLAAFAKIGGIYSHASTVTSAAGTGGAFALQGSKDQWTLKYGLGLKYDVSNRVTIRGEWEHYRNIGDITITGEGDVSLVSVSVILKF